MELYEYLRDARDKSGVNSNRKLAPIVGLKGNAISMYTGGRAWPSDEVMVKVALAGENDPAKALMDLNVWRSTDAARPIYEKIAAMMGAAIFAFVIQSAPVPAAPGAAVETIHYATIRGYERQRYE